MVRTSLFSQDSRLGKTGWPRFGYGLGVQRFERFRFSVPAVPLQTALSVLQYSLTAKDGSGAGFGSWKAVPAVQVPLAVSGKTVPAAPVWVSEKMVPTVPVSGSGLVLKPTWKRGLLEKASRVHCPEVLDLSVSLNRLNARLSLLHPLDRYRTS